MTEIDPEVIRDQENEYVKYNSNNSYMYTGNNANWFDSSRYNSCK